MKGQLDVEWWKKGAFSSLFVYCWYHHSSQYLCRQHAVFLCTVPSSAGFSVVWPLNGLSSWLGTCLQCGCFYLFVSELKSKSKCFHSQRCQAFSFWIYNLPSVRRNHTCNTQSSHTFVKYIGSDISKSFSLILTTDIHLLDIHLFFSGSIFHPALSCLRELLLPSCHLVNSIIWW